ncbi:hypothetical protein Sango_1889900 [Sesamum angolense]|uniref:ATP-dependent DNA helicase n=1 Tax=Sesamum angolense TaxID=2727404 RepID=A0AAE2BQM0_9LAMI|nr:hypothetical protein Sango_1889900 [Sesamum angolense]
MMHRYGIEAVSKTLKDLLKQNENFSAGKPFGGKLCILGGDFKQILPVGTKGRHESIVAASLHKSDIWSQCHIMHLKMNIRLNAQNDSTQSFERLRNFAEWIDMIGKGKTRSLSFPKVEDLIGLRLHDKISAHKFSHAWWDGSTLHLFPSAKKKSIEIDTQGIVVKSINSTLAISNSSSSSTKSVGVATRSMSKKLKNLPKCLLSLSTSRRTCTHLAMQAKVIQINLLRPFLLRV